MKNKFLVLSIATLLVQSLAYAAPPYMTPNITPHTPSPTVDITTKVTDQVSRTVSSTVSREMFANLIIPELKVRNSSGQVKQMKVSADKHYLSLLLADGSARVWDLDLGVQRPMITSKQPNRIAVDSKQQLVFASTPNGIDSYDVITGQPQGALPISAGTVNDIAVSADSSLLVSGGGSKLALQNQSIMLAANSRAADVSAPMTIANTGNKSLTAWNTNTKQLKWQQSDFSGTPDTITIAPNNRYAAIVCHENSKGDVLEIRDLSNGKKLQSLSNQGQNIIFSQFNLEATVVEVGYNNGDSIVWNLQSGASLSSKKLAANITAMDKLENTYAYVLDDGSVLVTDAQGNKLANINKENNPIRSVVLLAQGKKLITATENGQVFLWNVADGKELLQLISTKQGWTVLDNTGRFDSSELGMPNVSWQAGEEEIPFDNIATKYYEPGLFASALNDENYLNAKPNVIQQGIALPPKLQVSVNEAASNDEDVELTVDVYDQGGGIEEINLYHNDKVVNTQRSVVSDKTVKEQDRERRTLTVKLKPTAGKNQVKAVASNKLGIENQSNTASFTANVVKQASVLRIATIGINQYSDKTLDLDYSVADAESIEQLLTQKQFSKFSQVNKKQLHNQAANKLAILAVLRELSQGKQEDVLAIYFAGHGVAVNGEWYFLPYETKRRSDLSYYASVGISASEISEIFKNSNIQNILLMIDSCYSGASLDSFKSLQNSQRKFSRTISRSVGITIVTATRKNQLAAELADLGHGLFTYVLGKGMKGEADFMPQNNEISAHELANFSTRTIPNFAKRYINSAQEPTAFTMGQDFVLFNRK
jgi:WD40 repeat protein